MAQFENLKTAIDAVFAESDAPEADPVDQSDATEPEPVQPSSQSQDEAEAKPAASEEQSASTEPATAVPEEPSSQATADTDEPVQTIVEDTADSAPVKTPSRGRKAAQGAMHARVCVFLTHSPVTAQSPLRPSPSAHVAVHTNYGAPLSLSRTLLLSRFAANPNAAL